MQALVSNNKRGLAITALLVILLSFMALFSTPLVAHAGDEYSNPGGVDVTIDSSGGLTVTGGGFTSGGSADAWNEFISKYRNFIVGIAGIGAVTMIVIFIFQFLKLGASAGNPQARSQALVGCLWSGIAAAGLGAVTLIVGFFYNAFG